MSISVRDTVSWASKGSWSQGKGRIDPKVGSGPAKGRKVAKNGRRNPPARSGIRRFGSCWEEGPSLPIVH